MQTSIYLTLRYRYLVSINIYTVYCNHRYTLDCSFAELRVANVCQALTQNQMIVDLCSKPQLFTPFIDIFGSRTQLMMSQSLVKRGTKHIHRNLNLTNRELKNPFSLRGSFDRHYKKKGTSSLT